MIRYEEVKSKPNVLKSFSGLTVGGFGELVETFEKAYEEELGARDQQRTRQRQRGGGRKGALSSIEDKLLFILFYFKYYPVQEVQGYLFGMGQPQANEWVHRLTPVLNRALGHEQQLPARAANTIQQMLAACPG